jgi:SOS-response transcriptional repressor LexA
VGEFTPTPLASGGHVRIEPHKDRLIGGRYTLAKGCGSACYQLSGFLVSSRVMLHRKAAVSFLFIPEHIMTCKELSMQEKTVFGIIVGLTKEEGYCYASNAWIGEQVGLSDSMVSKHISKLVKKGFLSLEITKVKKNERTGQIGENYGTIRHIYAYQKGVMEHPSTINGAPPSTINGEYIVKNIYKEKHQRGATPPPNLPSFPQSQNKEGNQSPEDSQELVEYLERKKITRARKKAKKLKPYLSGDSLTSYTEKLIRAENTGVLDRSSGIAISLKDNVGELEIEELSKKHSISKQEVLDCKSAYIQWVNGSSYDKKVWGKDMFVYVDRFCSQKANKTAAKKDKEGDFYNQLLEAYDIR